MNDTNQTLRDALLAQIACVRDHGLPAYDEIPEGRIAAIMMRASLDNASKAMMEGDLAAMIAAYQDLKGYSV